LRGHSTVGEPRRIMKKGMISDRLLVRTAFDRPRRRAAN
jgi:hypothetical protein